MQRMLDPKPAPLAVFAAEFSSAENPASRIRRQIFVRQKSAKKDRLAEY